MLQSLAVADTGVLVLSLLLRSFRYLFWPDAIYRYVFIAIFPIAYAVRLVQTWLVVLLTVDRHIAVCHPLHAQRLVTVRRTTCFIVGLVCVAVLFSVPRYFEYQLVAMTSPSSTGFASTPLMANRVYAVAYRIVAFFVVMYLTPTVVLTVLNVRLLVALRESQAYQASSVVHFTRSGARTGNGNGSASPDVDAASSARLTLNGAGGGRSSSEGSVDKWSVKKMNG